MSDLRRKLFGALQRKLMRKMGDPSTSGFSEKKVHSGKGLNGKNKSKTRNILLIIIFLVLTTFVTQTFFTSAKDKISIYLEGQKAGLLTGITKSSQYDEQYVSLVERDDSSSSSGDSDDKDDDDKDKDKHKSLLDNAGIRVLIAIGVFAVLNVVVISIHHVFVRVSKSQNAYKEMGYDMSPF